jgi:hypothetical protein
MKKKKNVPRERNRKCGGGGEYTNRFYHEKNLYVKYDGAR